MPPALRASASRWRRNSPCMALSTPTKSSPVSIVWGPGSCAGRVFTIHSLSLIVNTCPSLLFCDTVPLSLFLHCPSPLLFRVAVHPQSCSPGLLESVIFLSSFSFSISLTSYLLLSFLFRFPYSSTISSRYIHTYGNEIYDTHNNPLFLAGSGYLH